MPTVHIPILGQTRSRVNWGGDTVMATMTLSLAAGAISKRRAAGHYAGGLVVMKRGTATVTAAGCGTPSVRVTLSPVRSAS